MWTEITRPQYERNNRRYASDLSDAEWDLIAPYMPPPKALGRPRTTALRDVVNAILYLLRAAAHGDCYPRTFHRAQPYNAISPAGAIVACGRTSIVNS